MTMALSLAERSRRSPWNDEFALILPESTAPRRRHDQR
jgi:hypothetical protein